MFNCHQHSLPLFDQFQNKQMDIWIAEMEQTKFETFKFSVAHLFFQTFYVLAA